MPCTIFTSGKHSVDHHRADLILSEPGEAHLDELLAKTVVTDKGYSEVLAKSTRCIQMTEHCMGPLKASGIIDKDIFCKILEKLKYLLIRDLKGE